jgi:hypothetical protein
MTARCRVVSVHRRAQHSDETGTLCLEKGARDGPVLDHLARRVMNLHDVDRMAVERGARGFDGGDDGPAAVGPAVGRRRRRDLRRDDHARVAAHGARNQALGVAVRGSRVDEGDAAIDGCTNEGDCLVPGRSAEAAGHGNAVVDAERHGPEGNRADGQTGAPKWPVVHDVGG